MRAGGWTERVDEIYLKWVVSRDEWRREREQHEEHDDAAPEPAAGIRS
jgi:hypothetical protein